MEMKLTSISFGFFTFYHCNKLKLMVLVDLQRIYFGLFYDCDPK